MISISTLEQLCDPEHHQVDYPASTVDANGVRWAVASDSHGCVLIRSEESLPPWKTLTCPTTFPADWTHSASYADVANVVRSNTDGEVCPNCLGGGFDDFGLCAMCDGNVTVAFCEPVAFSGVWINRALVWKYLSVVHADQLRVSWPVMAPVARPLGIAAADDSWRVFVMPMVPPDQLELTDELAVFPMGIVEPIGGDR